MPPPVPPRVNDGRMISGRPISCSTVRRLVHRVHDPAGRAAEADRGHGVAEQLAVFGLGDGIGLGADHLDAPALQRAVVEQLHADVQRRLPAHRRQQRVGALALDDLLDDGGRDRLDVGGIRHAGVGHDGGRVGVHQDHPVAFLPQRLARLDAGVVELAGLADDDRAGADDQDRVDVGALGHAGDLLGSAAARALHAPPPARHSAPTASVAARPMLRGALSH